jgi:hypothetical protein
MNKMCCSSAGRRAAAARGDQLLLVLERRRVLNIISPLFALFGSHSDLAIVCRRLQSNITKLRLQRQ